MVKDDHNVTSIDRENIFSGDAPEEYIEYRQALDSKDNAFSDGERALLDEQASHRDRKS